MLRLKVVIKMGEFCDRYMDYYAKPRKKSWREDERRIKKYILPALGDKPIDEITKHDILQLHAQIGKTSRYQANRTRENLHKMFRLAGDWDLLPVDHRNPASGIHDFPEVMRERFLTKAEAANLLRCLAEERCVYIRSAILLLLLTGLRKNELLTLTWKQIDWDERTAVVRGKNGELVYQPLNDMAIDILQALPRRTNNPYVIPGGKPGGRRWDLFKPWNKIRRRAGVPDVQIHDLRRTVATWITRSGTDLFVVKKVLNHKDIKSTLVYAKHSIDQAREALDKQGDMVQRLIS